MLNWIHPIWHDQPSVYGPLWTDLGWILATLTAPLSGLVTTLDDGTPLNVGLMDQVFAYKLLMNAVQLVNLALVWWLLGRSDGGRPRARLTAFVVFAWNPLMLFDAAGQRAQRRADGHAAAARRGAAGLASTRRADLERRVARSARFFVGMSALIKYTTGLVGLFYIVPWGRAAADLAAPACVWIGGTGAADRRRQPSVLFIPWLDSARASNRCWSPPSGKSWMYSNWARTWSR